MKNTQATNTSKGMVKNIGENPNLFLFDSGAWVDIDLSRLGILLN